MVGYLLPNIARQSGQRSVGPNGSRGPTVSRALCRCETYGRGEPSRPGGTRPRSRPGGSSEGVFGIGGSRARRTDASTRAPEPVRGCVRRPIGRRSASGRSCGAGASAGRDRASRRSAVRCGAGERAIGRRRGAGPCCSMRSPRPPRVGSAVDGRDNAGRNGAGPARPCRTDRPGRRSFGWGRVGRSAPSCRRTGERRGGSSAVMRPRAIGATEPTGAGRKVRPAAGSAGSAARGSGGGATRRSSRASADDGRPSRRSNGLLGRRRGSWPGRCA